MLKRQAFHKAQEILAAFPALGLIGPRQIGKTTLAKTLGERYQGSIYLDLESPADLGILANAEEFFRRNEDRR